MFSAIAGAWSDKVKAGATSQDSGTATPSDSGNVAHEVGSSQMVCVGIGVSVPGVEMVSLLIGVAFVRDAWFCSSVVV